MGPAEAVLRIGRFTLDARRRLLLGPDGAEVPLRPKSLMLLQLLARHAGAVVGRRQILDAVWPGLAVTDDSITQCIGEIRRALGPEGSLLRTVPKRGYLLQPAPDSAAPPRVRSRRWRAAALLLGSGMALVALVVLVRPSTPVAWRPGPSPSAVLPVADPAPPPSAASPARVLLEQGRAAAYRANGNRGENWLAARALFEKAIAAEPDFAPAYAEAAFTHTNMASSGLSPDPAAELRAAEALAERAVALAPDLPVVHAARAAVFRLQRRPSDALAAYRRAVELDESQHPSRANIGWMLILLGEPDGAVEPVLRSMALAEANHPFTGTWLTYLGIAELQIGRGDHGADRFRRALERPAFLSPDLRRLYLAAALALNGDTEEAALLVREVRQRQPELTAARLRQAELSDEPGFLARQQALYRGLALAGLPD
jgi:DNA-binding winged helix-turn-helix (wHTH) protein/Tfp pilus assembly protein PilF